MVYGLFQAHSGWRYIVIAVVVIAIIKLLIGWLTNGKWSKVDQGIGAALPIVIDIQLLLGLIVWATGFRSRTVGMVAEHITIMLISVVVAHIVWVRVKKNNEDATKFRTGALGFLLVGILIGVGTLRITGWM